MSMKVFLTEYDGAGGRIYGSELRAVSWEWAEREAAFRRRGERVVGELSIASWCSNAAAADFAATWRAGREEEATMEREGLTDLERDLSVAFGEVLVQRDAWAARHAALGRAALDLCDEVDSEYDTTTPLLDELLERVRREAGAGPAVDPAAVAHGLGSSIGPATAAGRGMAARLGLPTCGGKDEGRMSNDEGNPKDE